MTDTDPSSSSSTGSCSPGDDGPRSDGEPPSCGEEPAEDHPRCLLEIQNPCRYKEVGARALRPVVARMLAELAPGARSVTLRFVSDREMRRLNADYRQKDRPTDVLSFPGDFADGSDLEAEWPVAESGHLGDIAISVPTARRQAKVHGHGVDRELRFLVLHGLLHCLGYDHETDDGEMESLERRLRRRYLLVTGPRGAAP